VLIQLSVLSNDNYLCMISVLCCNDNNYVHNEQTDHSREMYFRVSICSSTKNDTHQPRTSQSTLYYSFRNHYKYILLILLQIE
jgi:hypothetical protein